jgi:hypothetical protein
MRAAVSVLLRHAEQGRPLLRRAFSLAMAKIQHLSNLYAALLPQLRFVRYFLGDHDPPEL